MPNVVSRDNANCPDDDRHRRGRSNERQQPEQVPWIYDRCTKKRCCHRPCKCVRRPCRGLASHPDCGKKAGEHCQPSYKLRSRDSLDRCKHRIIKAESLHVSADRKSTRLNFSHTVISYAVFCLKKKKKK